MVQGGHPSSSESGPPWIPPLPACSGRGRVDSPAPLGYRLLGADGPTVTLIHGLSRPVAFFARAGLDLSRSCRVLLADNPGFGCSRGQRVPLTIGEHARRHAATLRALGLPLPFHVAGLSLGGMVAMALAAELGRDCGSLTVIAASSMESHWLRLSPSCLLRQVAKVAIGRPEWRTSEFVVPERAAVMEGLHDEVNALNAREGAPRWGTFRQLLAATIFRARPLVPRITAPTRVVVGSRDRLVPPANSRRLAKILGAPLSEYRDVGHDFSLDGSQHVVTEVLRSIAAGRASPT